MLAAPMACTSELLLGVEGGAALSAVNVWGFTVFCQPDTMHQPVQVLLGAEYMQKKSKSKKSKAAQSTEDNSGPADDQENIANNASPPAEPSADPDNTMPALSRCLLKHAHLTHNMWL